MTYEMHNPKEYALHDLSDLVMGDFESFTASIDPSDVVEGYVAIAIDGEEKKMLALDGKTVAEAKSFLQKEIETLTADLPDKKLIQVKRELSFKDPATGEARIGRGEKVLTAY